MEGIEPSSQASLIVLLSSLIQWSNELADRRTHILAERSVEAVIDELLKDVCRPSGSAGDREDRGEHVGR